MRFVLIHGGFAGAWSWVRLIPELQHLGHDAIAIDLPGHGDRRHERSTLADRRDAILEVLQPGDVLLGHSGGGFDITLAADSAPEKVGHLIYLAAGVPLEGRPLVEATGGVSHKEKGADQVDQLNETISSSFVRLNDQGRLEWVDREAAYDLFFHDCDRAIFDWGYAQFSPAPPGILIEPIHLPRFWAADLPRSYIICLEDRGLPFATSMAFAGRLGVVPFFIEGSHSPMFSRPADLAEMMVLATKSKPVAPLRPN